MSNQCPHIRLHDVQSIRRSSRKYSNLHKSHIHFSIGVVGSECPVLCIMYRTWPRPRPRPIMKNNLSCQIFPCVKPYFSHARLYLTTNNVPWGSVWPLANDIDASSPKENQITMRFKYYTINVIVVILRIYLILLDFQFIQISCINTTTN